MSNTTGATCGAGTDYPSRETTCVTCEAGTNYPCRDTTDVTCGAVTDYYTAMFNRSLVEHLDIALHVPAIDYPFGIFKLLFSDWNDHIWSRN